MRLSRALLGLSSACAKSFTGQLAVYRPQIQCATFVRDYNLLKSSSHQVQHQTNGLSCLSYLAGSAMESANVSIALNNNDEDDEGDGLTSENVGKCDTTTTQAMDTVLKAIMHEETNDSKIKTNQKAATRKMKQQKRKMIKKKEMSDKSFEDLNAELPFALTSPTSWSKLGFPDQISTEKKRKRKRGESGARVDSEEDREMKKKKEIQRPNYFVSIPIINPQIKSTVTEVQEAMLQLEPRLVKAMIPVPTLHITLLVTHLSNQEQVERAASVLAEIEPSLVELLGGRDLVLPFSGISHFRKEVVFVGLAPGQHRHTLDSLAGLLRSSFEHHGLLRGDERGFEPHLTIMKLSRASKLKSQGLKRVDPALYSNYTNRFFGDQTVERLDLCSMLKKKQPDGYYHTETSLPLAISGERKEKMEQSVSL
ncbi:A-kinase anchor protein 7-like isoform X2 [Synchiropus splendidus]|uniref:A-kinase anchor protein 7-like isoform X2 n=1 Tax=Synchiropus splendidus TaxID=270530 RepID=UPI00237E9215|nr:A-kinase anchor protein 7-like isoform X2 [Synchiropus splendidus]